MPDGESRDDAVRAEQTARLALWRALSADGGNRPIDPDLHRQTRQLLDRLDGWSLDQVGYALTYRRFLPGGTVSFDFAPAEYVDAWWHWQRTVSGYFAGIAGGEETNPAPAEDPSESARPNRIEDPDLRDLHDKIDALQRALDQERYQNAALRSQIEAMQAQLGAAKHNIQLFSDNEIDIQLGGGGEEGGGENGLFGWIVGFLNTLGRSGTALSVGTAGMAMASGSPESVAMGVAAVTASGVVLTRATVERIADMLMAVGRLVESRGDQAAREEYARRIEPSLNEIRETLEKAGANSGTGKEVEELLPNDEERLEEIRELFGQLRTAMENGLGNTGDIVQRVNKYLLALQLATKPQLDLSSSSVSELSALSGLTALESLNLRGTQISSLSALLNISALKHLDLRDAKVSDLSALSNLVGLKSLNLTGCPISELSMLSGLKGLRYLNLTFTSVSDISSLSSLKNLQYLYLGRTRVHNISALSELSNLKFLNLTMTQVYDIGPLLNLRDLSLQADQATLERWNTLRRRD